MAVIDLVTLPLRVKGWVVGIPVRDIVTLPLRVKG